MRSVGSIWEFHLALAALRSVRVQRVVGELDGLHAEIGHALSGAGLSFVHEARIGSGRIDFLGSYGTGVEIKIRRPNAAKLLKQLSRYATTGSVSGLIVVVERFVPLPQTVDGVPIDQIALYDAWGVAV